MDVYLVDGTYELFRYFFALPSHINKAGREVSATRGVVGSMLGMLEEGITHLGVATDHVIESFRNDMWPTYKTSQGVDPSLLQQFPLLEEALEALGVAVWAMVELEADDALASAARLSAHAAEVDRVYICSPDKDLGQCVQDGRVVQLDRRKRVVSDEAGVVEKFGVLPESIPDYLALVGDSADGYPGLPGWGARSTASVLKRYVHLEAIPTEIQAWELPIRGADKLNQVLRERWEEALLFRDIATVRSDEALFESVREIEWLGPAESFEKVCQELESPQLLERAINLARKRFPSN